MKQMGVILTLIISIGMFVQPLQASHPEDRAINALVTTLLLSPVLVLVLTNYQREVTLLMIGAPLAVAGAGIAATAVVGAATVGAGAAGAVIGFPLWIDSKIEAMIDEETKEYRELIFAEGLEKDLTSVSQKIDQLITQLLNTTFSDIVIPIFPTIESKKFVLKNIQDFFEFKEDEKYKFFNTSIYNVCMKKINELEQEKNKQSGKEQEEEQSIDNVRVFFMEQIKGMNLTAQKAFIEQEMNKFKELSQADQQLLENNVKFLALLSIAYWVDSLDKSKKEKFLGKKEGAIGKEALKQKAAYIQALRTLPERKEGETEYTKEDIALKKQEILEKKSTQQSWWSTVKSWFGYY